VRVGLLRAASAVAPFVSERARVARVTLAATDGPEPVLFGSAAGLRTPVVVWPTDAEGLLDVAAVRAGAVRVTVWELSREEIDALAALMTAGWNLAETDLLVEGGPSAPRFVTTVRTLRASEFYPRLDAAALERIATAA
jgi:hypothetical protein